MPVIDELSDSKVAKEGDEDEVGKWVSFDIVLVLLLNRKLRESYLFVLWLLL